MISMKRCLKKLERAIVFPNQASAYRNPAEFKREEDGFKCVSCKSWVSASRESSGVVHRNHCPVCLVSLHVDLNKAGDRRAACRSRMVALGLTFKKVNKRYPGEGLGELMLIQRCTGCGKISINRIAADDNPGMLSDFMRKELKSPGKPADGTSQAGNPAPGFARIRRSLLSDFRQATDTG